MIRFCSPSWQFRVIFFDCSPRSQRKKQGVLRRNGCYHTSSGPTPHSTTQNYLLLVACMGACHPTPSKSAGPFLMHRVTKKNGHMFCNRRFTSDNADLRIGMPSSVIREAV